MREMDAYREFLLRDAVLVDVLSDTQYAREHIVGARNFCVYEVAFLDKITSAFNAKDEKIVLYGYSDNTEEAEHAKYLLEFAGYTNVHILAGGLKKWKEDNGAMEIGEVEDDTNGRYIVDAKESMIEWSGRKVGTRHRGTLTVAKGHLVIEKNEMKEMRVVVDMTTIDNLDLEGAYKDMLVDHLKSDDFFAVKNHPFATIALKHMKKISCAESRPNYWILADLTIKGVTHEVRFPAVVREKEGAMIVGAHFDIDRTEWGIKYGSEKFFAKLGMHVVNDAISLELNCTFVREEI